MLQKLKAMSVVFAFVATTGGWATTASVDKYKESTDAKLNEWDSRISLLKKKADTAGPEKDSRIRTAVRDLESHRDRIKDELGRVSENPEDRAKSENARMAIEKHLNEMEMAYGSASGSENAPTRIQ